MKTAAQKAGDKKAKSLTLACIKKNKPKQHQQLVIEPKYPALTPFPHWVK